MENSNQSISSEIIEVLEYFMDKLNLSFSIGTEQLLGFSQQLAEKIIRWEVLTSVVNIIIALILLTILYIIFKICDKKYNVVKHIKFTMLGTEKYKEEANGINFDYSVGFGLCLISVVVLFIVVLLAFRLTDSIVDLTQCILFPEKVILDFLKENISIN